MPAKNIWITHNNYDKLQMEDNASRLVNKLLTNHYAINKPGVAMPTLEKAERFKKLKDELGAKPITKEGLETVVETDRGA